MQTVLRTIKILVAGIILLVLSLGYHFWSKFSSNEAKADPSPPPPPPPAPDDS